MDVNVAVFFEAPPAVSLSPSMQIHASLYHIIGKRHIFAREPFSVGPEQVRACAPIRASALQESWAESPLTLCIHLRMQLEEDEHARRARAPQHEARLERLKARMVLRACPLECI